MEETKQLSFKKQKLLKQKEEEGGDIPEGWKDKFSKEDNKGGVMELTSFAVLFPKYRESYLLQSWPLVEASLTKYGVKVDLDLIEGSMTVSTKRETWDPYAIIRARDLVKLLSRGAPIEQARRVLKDDSFTDIIKIRPLVRNRERFIKRRQRLVGPNGTTLKAIELLTSCYVLVQGSTVSAIGSHRGLKDVRKIVEDCMNNVHPIYNIKTLMIKNELAKDPELKNESWERFLPKFKNKNVQRKKPQKPRVKREYTPFPPPQPDSKIDKQLASGEYFMQEVQRKRKQTKELKERQREGKEKTRVKRAKPYRLPAEQTYQAADKVQSNKDVPVDLDALKKKVGKAQKRK